MAAEVFTWCPMPGASVDYEYTTTKATLGDGLEQEAGSGLNNERQVWSLSFDGNEARVKAIEDFLRSKKGFIYFFWQPIGQTGRLKFKASNIKKTMNGEYSILSVTFRQHFGI